MTISEFDEHLARRGIRSSRGANSASEEHDSDTAATARQSHPSRPHTDAALHLAPPHSSGMTAEDLKVAHAAIQMKIVKCGISRSPPTLGELLTALKEHPDFDPHNHSIGHLPPEFFLNLSTADLEQGAWKFVDPKTAGAATIDMQEKLNVKIPNPAQSSTGLSSTKHQSKETPRTHESMADSNSSPSAPLDRLGLQRQGQGQGLGLGLTMEYGRGNGVVRPLQLPFAVPHTYSQTSGYGANWPVTSNSSLFPATWGPTPTTAYESTTPTEQNGTGGYYIQVCRDRVNLNGFPYPTRYSPTFGQYVAPQIPMLGSASQSTMAPYGSSMYQSGYQNVHPPVQHHMGMGHERQRAPLAMAPRQYGMNPFTADYGNHAPPHTRPIEPNQSGTSTDVQRPPCKSVPSQAMTVATAHLPFNPSRSRQGVDRILTLETIRRALVNNVTLNLNYKGEIDNYAIRNGSCTDQINCSVHVGGFDPNITQKEMLSLAQFARVAALSTHKPLLPRYPTAAAEYTFFKRPDAERFMWLGLQG
ncbi:hypothetical protein IFR05_004368 [Cadophora sp. M221]|nr:hypothetical protein IFR05_004368 [Cadophora sp. M221]